MQQPARAPEIEALFVPCEVRAYFSESDPAQIGALLPEERASIEPMAPKRQAEFATARACARAAMADLGITAGVPRRDGGAPQWPEGVAGSISHTRGVCVGVASVDQCAIGIDIEEIARMKPSSERRILVDAERDRLVDVTGDDRRRHVATIFAAKEAFYKAHYEVDPRYLGFDAVDVVVGIDREITFRPASGAVTPELLDRARGRVQVDHGRVIVGVTIAA